LEFSELLVSSLFLRGTESIFDEEGIDVASSFPGEAFGT
jgi:hypothetical protein